MSSCSHSAWAPTATAWRAISGAPLAEELIGEWIDRDDAEAAPLQACRHGATRFAWITRGPNHRDRHRGFEDLPAGLVCFLAAHFNHQICDRRAYSPS